MKLSELPKREALRERACFIYPQSKIPECPGYREVWGASSALRQHSGFLCPEGVMSEIPKGLCQCGCGGETSVAQSSRYGNIKGEPLRFLAGHALKGSKNHNWKGGKRIHDGYSVLLIPDSCKKDSQRYTPEHVVIAEKVLGKPLPENAVVHHHNRKRADNGPGNLVVCQDGAYHNLLHQRMRALRECGHARWRKCCYCKQYDDPENLYVGTGHVFHLVCHRSYQRERQNKIRQKEA